MEENYQPIATLHHLLNYEAGKFTAIEIHLYEDFEQVSDKKVMFCLDKLRELRKTG